MFSIGVLGFIVWAHGRLDKLMSGIVLMITPRSKFLCSRENSNEFFVSIRDKFLLFFKEKLSESELNLTFKVRLIDDPQNLEHLYTKVWDLYRTEPMWLG
jgi:hypothetical protein